MTTLITGATGFVGSAVLRKLLERGHAMRALVRAASNKRNLDGLRLETVTGDLTAPASLERALEGCKALFHVAADYRLWAPNREEIYQNNVAGTRNILLAAARAGVERVVYTSSVATLGLHAGGAPADETTPVSLAEMIGHYKRSKFLAEEVALDFARRGLPVVVVNPSAPVGPGDVKPTPTGRMIVDFMRGRMVATVDTGLNVVHVRDVARGHLLAAERGKPGARYILGHRDLSLAAIFGILAEITGGRAPRFRVPYAVAWLGAACCEGVARLTGTPPAVPMTAVRMSRKRMYFSPARAVRELGLPQTDVRTALADAVAWFEAHGYARGRARAIA
jgi:dihydroflavonol-4-reductase